MIQIHRLFRFIVLAESITEFVDKGLDIGTQTRYCLFGEEMVEDSTAFAVKVVGYGAKHAVW